MEKLRSEEGCPWDREQTHDTLKPYLIEEVYEVLESLDSQNFEHLKEELGDLLLQVIFHAQLANESRHFTIQEVIETINDKLIRRHPHVFGKKVINTAHEQRIYWEQIKKHEGKESVIDGVPKALPALLRAQRIQQKAATVGFDWEKIEQIRDKIDEELAELKTAIDSTNHDLIVEEFGDILFTWVNYSRFLHVNPEDALRKATEKFIARFQKLEKTFHDEGMEIQDATLDEMDTVWNKIKRLPN